MIKISINQKTGRPVIDLDENDLIEANQILAMMEMPGWERLMLYWGMAREALIQKGKDGSKDPAKSPLAAAKWALLDGFDEGISIPQRIIDRAKQFIEAKKEAEENEHRYDNVNGE